MATKPSVPKTTSSKGATVKSAAKLGVGTLMIMNIVAVVSLRGLPAEAEYGMSSAFYYLFAALVFLIPVSLVAAELADRCEIELAYAIGLADPVSVMVDTFGTGRVSDEKIASWLMEHIDMRPGSITSRFELRRPIYRRVSCGGHFGENAVGLPWEWTDIAEVLQKEILS